MLLGVGLVEFSFRSGRRSLQYLLIPLGMVAGALSAVPSLGPRGLTDLPAAVFEALRAGGLGQPPVPFDPGWRFMVVVLSPGSRGLRC